MSNKNKYTPRETPDYDFNEGLDITIRNIRSGEEEMHSLTPEELRSLPSYGQSPERDARVAEQIKRTTVAEGLGGRAVGFSVVSLVKNRNAENVVIHPYAWGGEKEHPLSVAGAQAIATAYPNDLHVFPDSPGIGKSDQVPMSIKKDIALHGHYGSLGEHMVRALEGAGVIDGRPVSLQGDSLGGRIAAGMAPHFKDGVKDLMLNDPTGSKRQSLFSLGQNFLIREGGHINKYREEAFDPVTAALHKQGFKIPLSEMARRLPQQFIIDSLGLTRESLAHDLADALPRVSGEVRIISPELSELNKWQDIADVFSKVADTAQSDALLEQWVVHRHTHSILSGLYPSITAKLYERRSSGSD